MAQVWSLIVYYLIIKTKQDAEKKASEQSAKAAAQKASWGN
jgi:hypothetical protein